MILEMMKDDTLPLELREFLKKCKMMNVSWDDAERNIGCWGNNITDSRQQHRIVVTKKGQPVEGGEGPWVHLHELDLKGDLMNDPRVIVPASQFDVVVDDPETGTKRVVSLAHALQNADKYWKYRGLKGSDFSSVTHVAIGMKVCFVPSPPPGCNVEIARQRFTYQARDAEDPINVCFLANNTGTYLTTDAPGNQMLFNHVHDKETDTTKSYATDVKDTGNSISNFGQETAEQAKAAAESGLGTSVAIGCCTWDKTSGGVCDIGIAVKQNNPQAAVGGMSSLGSLGSAQPEFPTYRSLSAPMPTAAGTEARTSIGSEEGVAPKLGNTTPKSIATHAVANFEFFVTVPYGHAPDKDTILQCVQLLTTKWKQAERIGEELSSRHSDEAIKKGLKSTAPLNEVTLAAIGEKMEQPAKKPRPAISATNSIPTPMHTIVAAAPSRSHRNGGVRSFSVVITRLLKGNQATSPLDPPIGKFVHLGPVFRCVE